jgi:hypothetical protein
MNVPIQGYIDVYIKLRPLRRKRRALVIDLPSMNAVLGMDFMARHDVTISCKQRTLSFPTATSTACLNAYHNMDSLPRCNSSMIEFCSLSAFANSIKNASTSELEQEVLACLTPEF